MMIELPLKISRSKWKTAINRANMIHDCFIILKQERRNELLIDCVEKRIPYQELLKSDNVLKSIESGRKEFYNHRAAIRKEYVSGIPGPWILDPKPIAKKWLLHYESIREELKYRACGLPGEKGERLPILKITNKDE